MVNKLYRHSKFQNLIGMLGSLATSKKSGEKEAVSKPYRYARKAPAVAEFEKMFRVSKPYRYARKSSQIQNIKTLLKCFKTL